MPLIKLREFKDTDYPAVLEVWKLTNLGEEKRGDNLIVIKNSLLQRWEIPGFRKICKQEDYWNLLAHL